MRGAADGVLVEIEAEFAGAAAGGGGVGRHREDGGARLDGAFGEFHRRDLHGARVGFQAFGAGQGGDGRREFAAAAGAMSSCTEITFT